MAKFLQSKQLADPLKNALLSTLKGEDGEIDWYKLGTEGFDAAWTQITTNPETRKAFGDMQHDFNVDHHLTPMNNTVKKAFGDNQDINNALNNEYFKEAIYAGAIQWGGKKGAERLVIPVLKQAQKEGKLGDTMYLLDLFYENRKKQPREVTNQYKFRKVPDLDKDGKKQMVIPVGGGAPVVKMKDEKYVSGKNIVYWRGRDYEKGVIVAKMKADRRAADDLNRTKIAKTTTPTAKPQSAPATNESLLRHTIQEALKRKFSPLKEEVAPTQLYQVVLVLSVEKPIKDIAGKLNKIRSIEGVTIVSHETDDDVIHRGDIVAKIKFMPKKNTTRPMTYVKQVLEPSINSSTIVPEVKVLQVVHGTIKEI